MVDFREQKFDLNIGNEEKQKEEKDIKEQEEDEQLLRDAWTEIEQSQLILNREQSIDILNLHISQMPENPQLQQLLHEIDYNDPAANETGEEDEDCDDEHIIRVSQQKRSSLQQLTDCAVENANERNASNRFHSVNVSRVAGESQHQDDQHFDDHELREPFRLHVDAEQAEVYRNLLTIVFYQFMTQREQRKFVNMFLNLVKMQLKLWKVRSVVKCNDKQ
ncbi:hypothetical protein RFI_13001 [Reticulomyxa filosa]|uniref:Uncharacterized protein n=1 Tax=Reticulomyxa filosa TaxID=46433 RepID=X6NE41_RETFI|nr:hypothetical protein RFI_13001 [Reticulomyxa filosa]|eukprot:ETO24158.1 hypothetical protein RFI_13001 [Reticulomyxa filosa]